MNFHQATPILRVADLAASLAYYLDVLGFHVQWRMETIACVSRGDCGLVLCEGDQGNPGSWVWIGVGDAEALHAELEAKGAKVRNPPANFPWAIETQIEDLDGNVLRFGSEPIEGRPYSPWKDMHGRLWELR